MTRGRGSPPSVALDDIDKAIIRELQVDGRMPYAKLGPAKKDYAILSQSISVEPLALGLRKGETALKTQVDGVLRELESSGEAEKLFFKWYGPSTKLQFDKRSFKIDSDKIAG